MANGKYVPGSTVKSVVRAAFLILAVLAFIGCIAVHIRRKQSDAEALKAVEGLTSVYFLDVGQGDACLVRSPNGHYMLIDAGPTDHESSTVHFLRALGVSTLDVLVMTHPHEDHFGGMTQILHSFPVDRFVAHRDFADVYPVTRFRKMFDDSGTAFVGVSAGDTFNFDGLLISILSPLNADQNDYNESSLCIRLSYGDTSFLFTGDIGQKTENALLSSGANLHSDVLKVAHHGSSASTGVPFLEAVNPSAAVLSVGKDNDYGHPSSVTLKALSDRGIDVYRTDTCGTVQFVSNGVAVYHMTSDDNGTYYASPLASAA